MYVDEKLRTKLPALAVMVDIWVRNENKLCLYLVPSGGTVSIITNLAFVKDTQ